MIFVSFRKCFLKSTAPVRASHFEWAGAFDSIWSFKFMNTNFKVVFNKARGALMVANEITSSVQAKGTKTVVAAAVAMAISGTALAASQYVEPASGAEKFTAATTIDQLKTENVFTLTPEGEAKVPVTLLSSGEGKTVAIKAGQSLWVIGNNKNAQATGLWSSGNVKSVVENNGTIYVTSNAASGGVTWQNRAMGVDKGTATNNGVIVVKDAYGITVGSSGDNETAKIVNGVDGKIYVEDRGVGIELGGIATGKQTKAEATNSGEIYASAAKDFGATDKNGKFTYAVQIKGDSDSNRLSGQKFVNDESGKIYAADATAALYVQYTSGAQVVNNGLIEGDIVVDAGASGTQLTFDAASVTKGDLVLKGAGTVINAPTKADEFAVLTGDILAQAGTTSQSGSLVANNLAVGVAAADDVAGTSGAYTLNAGATLGVKTTTVAYGTLTVTGEKAALTTDELTVASSGSGSIVSGGALTAGKFTNNGTVTISGDKSVLTVTGEAANNASGSVALGASGTFVVAEGATLTNTGSVGGTLGSESGTLTVDGTVINKGTGKLYVDTLVVNGLLDTNVKTTDKNSVAAFHFNTITLNENGVIKVNGTVDEVNTFYAEGSDGTKTLYLHDGTWNLNGGTIEVNDKGNVITADADAVLGMSGATATLNIGGTYELGDVSLAKDAGNVTVTAGKGANLTAKKVTFAGANHTIKANDGALVSVAELSLTGGASATVSGGSLTVTDKLTATSSDNAVVVTVSDDGELNATLAALGIKLGDTVTDAETVGSGAITLDASSALNVTDDLSAVTLTTADVKKLTGKLAAASTGLLDLGSLTIKDLVSDKGEAKYSAVKELNGVTTEALKGAKVTGVNEALTHSQSWGSLTLDSLTEVAVSGAVLTLNGNGQLATYDTKSGNTTTTHLADVKLSGADAGFIVDGTGAESATIGTVYSENGTNGFFTVAGTRDVTVEGDVKVGELEVEKDAKLAVVQSKNEGSEAPEVTVSDLQVAGAFDATASKVVVNNTSDTYYNSDPNAESKFNEISQIAGTASVKDLEVAGDFLVTGTATVAGDLNVGTDKTVYVGNNESAGTMIVGNLASGSVFADPAWDVEGAVHSSLAVKTAAEGTTVEAGRNSIVALGTDSVAEGEALLKKSGFALADTPVEDDEANGVKAVSAIDTRTVNSVLYVNGGKTIAEDGTVSYAKAYLGNATASYGTVESHGYGYGVYVDKNSMLAIDLSTVDTEGVNAVFDKDVELEHDSILFLDNAVNGDQVKLSAGSLTLNADAVFEGDLLMDVVELEGEGNEGKFGIQMLNKDDLAKYEIADLAGFGAAYGMFEEGKNLNNNSSSAQFNKWLYSTTTSPVWQKFSDGSYDVNLSALKKITTDVASLGATTGVQTLTMDAVNQMADTVADRTSVLTQRGQGVNVWADVNGGKFEAKKLFDGAGYSSDIYSGVLGLDYQFSCNAVLGAALTIGTADTDSKNTGVAASTDTDLVGFSVYASKTFADIWNVAADIGYLSASNDVTANGYDHAWKFSQDTDAFTVGVRGEVLTKAGVVNIVPHVGLRYTALSTDGFEAGYVTDIDDQNIFQMPVGVALSADFETNGWTLAPKFDLSVVPTFGDKDADLKLGISGVSATDDLSVRVIDSNPVQATLGINATNGDWGFGLSYKLGVGSDERQNNSFNATVRYAF